MTPLTRPSLYVFYQHVAATDDTFGQKEGEIGSESQNVLKTDPRFVIFGANLSQFLLTPDTTAWPAHQGGVVSDNSRYLGHVTESQLVSQILSLVG